MVLLGIIYDKKMNLNAQINKTITKAKQRTGLLKRLRGTGWGTSSKVLIKLYVCFIRPILEYGAVLTAGVSKTNMKKLQVVQNNALRLALNNPRKGKTRITSLHERAGIDMIETRLINLKNKSLARYEGSKLMIKLNSDLQFLENCR